jgi:hypothetical protein
MAQQSDDDAMARDSRLDLLALILADDGPAAHEATVADFIAHVRAGGLQHLALDVLADPSRPDVIRQRAFGAIHAALLAPRPGPDRSNRPRPDEQTLIVC